MDFKHYFYVCIIKINIETNYSIGHIHMNVPHKARKWNVKNKLKKKNFVACKGKQYNHSLCFQRWQHSLSTFLATFFYLNFPNK